MAAVTINKVKYNVNGSLRDQIYNISGNTGDFLQLGLFNVMKIDTNPGSLITAVASAPGTIPGTSVITFTSSAAMVNEIVEVLGN
jgi:hypothetical protein